MHTACWKMWFLRVLIELEITVTMMFSEMSARRNGVLTNDYNANQL